MSSPEPRDDDLSTTRGGGRDADRLRRRAGCLWDALTEPWVLLGLTLAAVIFGRAFFARRAKRQRELQQPLEDDDG